MEKVIVIGCPGSGKSTFARALRERTNLPLYHLDMIWHKPDRTNVTREEFDRQLGEILRRERWIIDGNYSRTLELRIKHSDTVFLLDFPVELCLSGVESRIGYKREDMPWVESEFDGEFKRLICDFHRDELSQIYALLDKYSTGRETIVFKTRQDVKDYLQKMIC